MYNNTKPSAFCQHYNNTRHYFGMAASTSYSDTTSTDSNGLPSPSAERRRKMTFAWAAEQEFLRSEKKGMTTEEWVKQQREFQTPGARTTPRTPPKSPSRKTSTKTTFIGTFAGGETRRLRLREVGGQSGKAAYVIETADSTDEEAEWENAQRTARARRIREEFKRMEDHLKRKEETQREERAERERKARIALEEKEKRDHIRIERLVRESWKRYQDGWTRMTGSTDEQLSFESIPWPVMNQVNDPDDLTKNAITGFLFSPLHSQELGRKERLRSALLRWHPDRFTRFTGRIVEQDKDKVIKAVDIITSILNNL